MKISIITVCRNSATTIHTTIKSVVSQTYPDIEYIIVDGNSTDSTVEIIKEHAALFNIRFVSEADKGIYDAMNKGIQMATGQVIGILNSDDFYSENNIVEKIMCHFAQHDCDAVYGDIVYIDKNNEQKTVRYWKSQKYRHGAFKWGWMPPHTAFFVKKTIYDKFGLFCTEFKNSADYEFMLRVIHKGRIKLSYISQILTKMRIGGTSNINLASRLNANKEDRLAWEINEIKPFFFTLYLKPLRKLMQYLRKP